MTEQPAPQGPTITLPPQSAAGTARITQLRLIMRGDRARPHASRRTAR